ncbi:hypothetical protein T190_04290 [Sinorhizobium meliloti CCBAU 01290]|nr:hypothetical protein T190_04290 [Sinorhizobium meliloti CCBAU 01290]
MRAVTEMPIDVAARITVLFADIDDTLTNEGLLPPQPMTRSSA